MPNVKNETEGELFLERRKGKICFNSFREVKKMLWMRRKSRITRIENKFEELDSKLLNIDLQDQPFCFEEKM